MMTTKWAFYVGGKPFILHQHGDRNGAVAFYEKLDPKAFLYWTLVEAHAASNPMTLDGAMVVSAEDAGHLAALRFRQYYLSLLETFFAHLFANVQAPLHPAGWLCSYREQVLSKLVERLHTVPWSINDTTRLLSHPNDFVAWIFGLERVNADRDACVAEAQRVVALIGALAREFSDRGNRMEYNSIKHGGRAHSAAWSLSISAQEAPDKAAGLRAGNGSHFGIASGIGTNQLAWRSRSQGWTLERDIRVAIVISKLLHNLVQVRTDESIKVSRSYFRFDTLDLAELLRGDHAINHFEMGHPDLPKDEHVSEAAARHHADAEQRAFEAWLYRLGDGTSTGGDPSSS